MFGEEIKGFTGVGTLMKQGGGTKGAGEERKNTHKGQSRAHESEKRR